MPSVEMMSHRDMGPQSGLAKGFRGEGEDLGGRGSNVTQDMWGRVALTPGHKAELSDVKLRQARGKS